MDLFTLHSVKYIVHVFAVTLRITSIYTMVYKLLESCPLISQHNCCNSYLYLYSKVMNKTLINYQDECKSFCLMNQ